MTITPDLREIEEKATAATPGPWTCCDRDDFDGAGGIDGPDNLGIADVLGKDFARTDDAGFANAAHIARMDPPTTLALVARIRELEGALKPFAEWAHTFDARWRDGDVATRDSITVIRVSDLRRAATAYKGG